MPLTPDDFRRDLNEEDLRQIRQQVNADRIRSSRVVELTIRSNCRPLLEAGKCVWLDQYQIVGRYEVVIAERSYSGHRYTLIRTSGPKRPGEETIVR